MMILAISGSLRSASSNTSLLRAAAALAPEGVEVALYDGLGDLPHFNPDMEKSMPAPVVDLRERVGRAGGILISCPEYAHGVPGVLKNGLDWLVSSEEFPYKPVALFNASANAAYARASLTETLKTMSARLIDEAEITLPLVGTKLDDHGIAAHPQYAPMIRAAIETFVREVKS